MNGHTSQLSKWVPLPLLFFILQEKANQAPRICCEHCVIHITLAMVSTQRVRRPGRVGFADSRMNYVEVCFGIDAICKTSPIV